ncbi:MAG: hypothetical protein DCF19_02185 [Pseudanabaena frigida]|uniref:Uncharacterized protein n=1 Tax=Pseudanabaena frigida TaxID=945775 RepID=A0A2W4WN16_9CYAN|nr:MAG: hypothetical protein DCF19_02185 [Pseudanabaena frigida]
MDRNINKKISSLLKRVLKIEQSLGIASEACSCFVSLSSTNPPPCDPRECPQIKSLVDLLSKLRQQINELEMQTENN